VHVTLTSCFNSFYLALFFIFILCIIFNSSLSFIIIVSSAQCVQQTLPASYTNAKLGTALVTSHIQRLLSLRTTAGTLTPAVLLHGTILKERDKGTLASQMADVKEN
jgi:hypothetical protein